MTKREQLVSVPLRGSYIHNPVLWKPHSLGLPGWVCGGKPIGRDFYICRPSQKASIPHKIGIGGKSGFCCHKTQTAHAHLNFPALILCTFQHMWGYAKMVIPVMLVCFLRFRGNVFSVKLSGTRSLSFSSLGICPEPHLPNRIHIPIYSVPLKQQ